MVKVSILVPIYNVEKYLDQCLETICGQTLKEIEIICINDGSTDESKNIIEKYAKNDPRIIVINKENTGYGHSMNIGLDKAVGKYIAIVESDDFIEKDMMEQLYIEAERSSIDFLKSNLYFYSDNKKEEKNEFFNIFDGIAMNQVINPMEKIGIFFKAPAIWTGMYLREFLMKNNIRFNETPGASYQDVSFNFQAFACANKVLLLSKAYYHYRISNLNSSVKSPNKVFCICDELDKIEQFIEEKKEKKNIRMKIASRLGYSVFIERYHGLASAFQYTLFLKIVEYLKKYKKCGYITEEVWASNEIEEVENILKNPNQYFMETAKSFKDNRILDEKSPALNYFLYGQVILKEVLKSEKIIIYGAGQIGKEFLRYLLKNRYEKNNICFAVTDSKENQLYVEEIPVLQIEKCQNWKEKAIVAVAVKEQNQFEILQKLEKMSFKKIVAIDQIVQHTIKEESKKN